MWRHELEKKTSWNQEDWCDLQLYLSLQSLNISAPESALKLVSQIKQEMALSFVIARPFFLLSSSYTSGDL